MPEIVPEVATYHVRWGARNSGQQEDIAAAYVMVPEKVPGFVLFKNREHQTVAMVASDLQPVIIRKAAA
jgi:hypothetical protein